MGKQTPNHVGHRHGMLTVVSQHHPDAQGRTQWAAICDCGQLTIIRNKHVGSTRSCGCLWSANPRYVRQDRARTLHNIFLTAHKRNKAHLLSYDKYAELIDSNCAYYGREPAIHRNGYVLQGIDRIDSNGFYTDDNVAPCCTVCNQLKSDLSVDVFLAHCKQVTHFQRYGNDD